MTQMQIPDPDFGRRLSALENRVKVIEESINRAPRKREELTSHAMQVLNFLKEHAPLKFNGGAIAHNIDLPNNLVNSAIGSLVSRNLINRQPIISEANKNKEITHRTKYSYWVEKVSENGE